MGDYHKFVDMLATLEAERDALQASVAELVGALSDAVDLIRNNYEGFAGDTYEMTAADSWSALVDKHTAPETGKEDTNG